MTVIAPKERGPQPNLAIQTWQHRQSNLCVMPQRSMRPGSLWLKRCAKKVSLLEHGLVDARAGTVINSASRKRMPLMPSASEILPESREDDSARSPFLPLGEDGISARSSMGLVFPVDI